MAKTVKVRQFKVRMPTDKGTVVTMDGLEYEGALWLVPEWCDLPDKGLTTPVRIVRMDTLPHQNGDPSQGYHFVLNEPVPTAVLNGKIPPEEASGYEVVNLPRVAIRGGHSVQ